MTRGPVGQGFPAVVCAPSVALPEYAVGCDDVIEAARTHLGEDYPHLGRLLSIVRNSGVERRHFVRPLSETVRARSPAARNDVFIDEAVRLGKRAAAGALAAARLSATDIDFVITTSCTGVMIPSLCAHLLPDMGFRPQTKRLPITELGCAAGAVALSRAREFCQIYRGANVLVISTELCSLTFQPGDTSFHALVGATLFGDGAAACVVRGEDVEGFRLEANESFLFPQSLRYMGFDVRDGGLHLVLDKRIPRSVEQQMPPVFEAFLTAHGLRSADIGFFCLHPGGRRILEELEKMFRLARANTAPSWECLAEVGNLSSASILVVLRNLFERHRPEHGRRGLLAAFGPGFSAEMALGTWNGA